MATDSKIMETKWRSAPLLHHSSHLAWRSRTRGRLAPAEGDGRLQEYAAAALVQPFPASRAFIPGAHIPLFMQNDRPSLDHHREAQQRIWGAFKEYRPLPNWKINQAVAIKSGAAVHFIDRGGGVQRNPNPTVVELWPGGPRAARLPAQFVRQRGGAVGRQQEAETEAQRRKWVSIVHFIRLRQKEPLWVALASSVPLSRCHWKSAGLCSNVGQRLNKWIHQRRDKARRRLSGAVGTSGQEEKLSGACPVERTGGLSASSARVTNVVDVLPFERKGGYWDTAAGPVIEEGLPLAVPALCCHPTLSARREGLLVDQGCYRFPKSASLPLLQEQRTLAFLGDFCPFFVCFFLSLIFVHAFL